MSTCFPLGLFLPLTGQEQFLDESRNVVEHEANCEQPKKRLCVYAGVRKSLRRMDPRRMFSQKSPARYLILVSVVTATMFAIACGGSDDSDSGDSPTSAAGSQGGSSPTATSQSSSSSNIPVDTGVVNAGNKKFDFSMDEVLGIDLCFTAFGVVAGNGMAMDGSDIDVEFDIPPVGYKTKQGFEDYDLPSLTVGDKVNDHQWAAGGDFSWLDEPPKPDESRIGSYTNDGRVVTGTATFIELNAYRDFVFGFAEQPERPEPVNGTFEIHCGT